MVDIIPKQGTARFSGTTLLFLFGLLVFAGTSSFFFFMRAKEIKASMELIRVREALSRGKTQEEIQLEKTILRVKQKLEDFQSVSSETAGSANFFLFLEEITHPHVTFTQLNLQAKNFQAALSGSARDFESLDQQMELLKGKTELVSSRLSNIGLGPDGQVAFRLDLAFQKSFFKE
ncbi:MAG: hypothetical protein HYV78_01260 [Candidatus Wildermuthbacteria bacterium]|nr:hypothetical protein [Candidatus Wildermuthbacteria bacterium]